MKKITTNRMNRLKIYVASQKVITLNDLQVLFPDIDLEIIKYFIGELVDKKMLKATDKIGVYKKVTKNKAEKTDNKKVKRREIINYICARDIFSKNELKIKFGISDATFQSIICEMNQQGKIFAINSQIYWVKKEPKKVEKKVEREIILYVICHGLFMISDMIREINYSKKSDIWQTIEMAVERDFIEKIGEGIYRSKIK